MVSRTEVVFGAATVAGLVSTLGSTAAILTTGVIASGTGVGLGIGIALFLIGVIGLVYAAYQRRQSAMPLPTPPRSTQTLSAPSVVSPRERQWRKENSTRIANFTERKVTASMMRDLAMANLSCLC